MTLNAFENHESLRAEWAPNWDMVVVLITYSRVIFFNGNDKIKIDWECILEASIIYNFIYMKLVKNLRL